MLLGALLAAASVLLGWAVHATVPAPDAWALRAVGESRSGPLGTVARVVSTVLSPGLATGVLVLLGALAGVQCLRRRHEAAWLLLRCGLLLGVCWLTVLARYAYRRVRPIDYPQWSYPSGHVTAVGSVAVVAVVLCARLAARQLRTVALLALLAVLVTGVSRVVLRMHWPTDVLGAMLAVGGVGLVAAALLGLLPTRAAPSA
ncbi:phosphatase PAP2 family protein [Solihabitans fulvus]|uniref:Phosphatase PAP2 family protein n=1 Tax=Solihabitans fulvus TaxID=1892852 RepID=A0A5B2XN90_9PSEU|nr:phosphatase PAP2 family protein [Solihabitans fulvus]